MKTLTAQEISAFAFHTGKQIELIIQEATDDLAHQNCLLHAQIISFRQKIKTTQSERFLDVYDEHFHIKEKRQGCFSSKANT